MKLFILAICLTISSLMLPAAVAKQQFTISEQSSELRLRQESLQWLPETVTVIKKSAIESTYRRDLEDLEGFAPGVIIDQLSGTPQGAAISIRGIGSAESGKGFEPAVAVSIDGVYVGTHTSQLQVLFDFEQIDIARGPQVTYQSAPNLSGTVDIQRTLPTGELGAAVRASVGDFSGRELDAVLNAPITDSIAGKLSFSWQDEGGDYMKNVISGRQENSRDRLAISGSLLWNYNDKLTLQYTYDVENDDSKTLALLNLSTSSDLVCINAVVDETCGADGGTVPQTGSITKTAQNFSNNQRYQGRYHTLRLDLDWMDHAITSITGFRKTDEKMDRDLDATQVDFYSTSSDQEYSQFSQEFRASRQLNDRLHYATGLSFMNYEYDLLKKEFFILNALGNAGLTPAYGIGDVQQLRSRTKTQYQSAFVHIDYALNDQWQADIGTRYTKIDKDFKHNPLVVDTIINPTPVNINDSGNWNELGFSAGLSFKVDDQAMIYTRFSQGFRPGGFNEAAVSAESAQAYDSETSENWEIGMKSEWFDDALRLNMAYYQISYKDKLERFVAQVGAGRYESVLDNVAEVETDGFELEFEWAARDNLYFRGSFNHMNSSYQDYTIPDPAGGSIRLTGLEPVRAPVNSLYLSALYSFNFASGVINTYAGYKLVDDYQTNPNLQVAAVHNYLTIDLSIDYAWEQWTFRLFSQNFRDKQYMQNAANLTDADIVPLNSANATGLITYSEYNQPRYIGFEVIYQTD